MSGSPNNKIYANLPRAGLGNKMLVWARAFVAAHANNMDLVVSPWWGISPGAWIRREKKKRLYLNYFKEDGLIKRWQLRRFRKKAEVIVEPAHIVARNGPTLFEFNQLFTDKDFFKDLKPYRNEVRDGILGMLQPALRKKLDAYPTPEIGIHVRRGDFKLGSTITPEDFFVDAILRLREMAGRELAVTVFTDADVKELPRLFSLPSVQLSGPKEDILDILLLGRSKIVILSISSTFSFWGAFLNDGIVLKHPDEWHPEIRPAELNRKLYEGKVDWTQPIDPVLKEQLLKLAL